MLEEIDARNEMVMDVDQVGDLRGGTLISLSIHGDFWRQNKRFITLNEDKSKKDSKKV